MLKKIAVTALLSSFAIASFAQAGATATTPAKISAPAATEQKADKPHCDHKKHPHCNKMHKSKSKTEAPAATK